MSVLFGVLWPLERLNTAILALGRAIAMAALAIMVGLPVVFALLASPIALIMLEGDQRNVVAGLYRNLYNGMDSFPLMALPFVMLAGEIMNRGGITLRLVAFSQAFMGHLRGGLAHVNILSSILFAGLSGSAVADTSALRSTPIPAMEKTAIPANLRPPLPPPLA